MPTATLENLFELSAVVAPLAAAGGSFATILFFLVKHRIWKLYTRYLFLFAATVMYHPGVNLCDTKLFS